MHLNWGFETIFNITDPLRVYHLNYWTYVFTGFWVCESEKPWKTNLFKMYQFLLFLLYSITVLSFFIDAASVRHDLDKLSFNMTSSILVLVTLTKVSLLRLRRNDLEGVLSDLNSNLQAKALGEWEENKEVLKKRAKFILDISRLLYGLLVMCYSLRVVADTMFGTKAYLIPMPFKDKLENQYGVIYTQQAIIITHFLVTVIAHDLLIYGVLNRIIAHFEVLEKSFLRIKSQYPKWNFKEYVIGYKDGAENDNAFTWNSFYRGEHLYKKSKMMKNREEKTKQILKDCVHHHQKLLKVSTNFLNIYSQPLIIQICGTVMLIGITIIKILFLSDKITILLLQQIMYAGITLTNILCLCSFGSELTSKSTAVADALYDTPWYEMDLNNRVIICTSLTKLMEGPKLRGGSLINVNRVTYLKVLRISYNVVAVLRKMY